MCMLSVLRVLSLTPQNIERYDGKTHCSLAISRLDVYTQVQASDAQTDSKDVRHSDHACPRIATGLLDRSRVTVSVGSGVVYLRI